MKALKSERAKALLADPRARDQLRRHFARTALAGTAEAAQIGDTMVIEVPAVHAGGRPMRLMPAIVPKAA